MPRVTVYHLTPPANLPLIEEDGLLTRAAVVERHGPLGELDEAAPGTFAHGKRVSGYLDLDHARSQADRLGAGLVSYSVDDRKSLAAPDGLDGAAHWEAAKPLAAWGGDAPDDLAVHTNKPVRAKYVRIHAPLLTDDELGDWAPVVTAVADEDRLSAKALMHLAIIRSDGDFTSEDFLAACALAWRDVEDDDRLVAELAEIGPDKVASAALAEFASEAPELQRELRDELETTRAFADENGLPAGEALFARTALILDEL